MNKEKESTTTNLEKAEDALFYVGTSITLAGIGVIVSGGVTENPRLLAAGGAAMALGLLFYSTARTINVIRQTASHSKHP